MSLHSRPTLGALPWTCPPTLLPWRLAATTCVEVSKKCVASFGSMGTPEPLVVPPHHLLAAYADVNVCAPMVRYSKLPFRALVAQYETHITTTPMILASEFSRNQHARDADFTTNVNERGVFDMVHVWDAQRQCERPHPRERVRGALMCQFAASEASTLADAAELVSPYVDGIDLNCGWCVLYAVG